MSGDDSGDLVPRFMRANAKPTATPAPSAENVDEKRASVRPFLVTGGRTEVDPSLRLESQLVAVADPTEFSFELASVLELTATPSSVAEVSAHLKLPVGAVKVLASDLIAAGALQLRQAQANASPSTIRELIDAVSAL